MAVTTTLQDGAIEWFGRSSMTKTNQSIQTHSVTNGTYPYQVTNRTPTGRYTSSSYLVPFLVAVGTKQAVVQISGGYVYFTIIGSNVSSPAYTTITVSETTSTITGFSNKLSEYQISVATGMPYMWDDEDFEVGAKLRVYYYEDTSLFVVRYENSTSTYEIWVTPDGYIQVIGSLSGVASNLTTKLPATYTKDKDIKCSDVDSSGDNLCRYRVARKSENIISVKGTVTLDCEMTLYYNSTRTKVSLTTGMTSSDVANLIKSNFSSDVTSAFNITVTSNTDGTATVNIIAKSTGNTGDIPSVSVSSYGTGVTLNNSYTWGCNATYCNYYSTSRASCYYGGYTTNYVSSSSVVQHTYSDTKNPAILFKLNEDGTITKFENKHIPRQSTPKKILTVSNESDICRDGLFLYDRKLTTSELGVSSRKSVSFNVDGQTLFGHFIPENQSASKAEILPQLRLSYGGEVLKAVNYALTTKSLQCMPVIKDKQYNTCYYSTGSTKYYWNYTEIYSFYEPLANISEIRCLYYSDISDDSYTELPNDSYPNLYFCYRSTFDNTNSSSSWSGVNSIALTTPIYNKPHLVVFKFTSPITVAQWCIVPMARGSGYSTNASYGFSSFNIITNDGLSLNYKL